MRFALPREAERERRSSGWHRSIVRRTQSIMDQSAQVSDDRMPGGRATLRSGPDGRFEVVYVAGLHNLHSAG